MLLDDIDATIEIPFAAGRQRPDAADADARFTDDLLGLMPLLRNQARHLYRDSELAADLAQDTLAKAWQARGSFTSGTNLKAWLLTIMRNQFHSNARRSWRQVRWDQEAAEQMPGPRAEQFWAIQLADTTRALAGLSRRQREALLLIGLGGHSTEDAAALCGSRSTAMKSRLSRARETLRSILEGKEPFPGTRPFAGGDAAGEMLAQLDRLATQPAAGAGTTRPPRRNPSRQHA
ncbi:MAG TPA: sigma-70 family RNA polymerase sigma factor [Rhizomicrobium sp.]|jgi:RNA polymerase sigma-70 factor (ECF subfamily)|nr:sigma-70 family RNA polymerase sigma factor [Rhizomicrobium sp.]